MYSSLNSLCHAPLSAFHLSEQIKMTEGWFTPQKLDRKMCENRIPGTHHQCRDDFIGHLLAGDHISAGLRVDDAFFFLPTHHDGLLTVGYAAHPLFLTLRGQSGVGVGGDHGWDWMEVTEKSEEGSRDDKNGEEGDEE